MLAVALAASYCSGPLHAEEQIPDFVADEMIVTATKTRNSVSGSAGSSVTVITAEEIKSSGLSRVEDLLRGTPGLDIVSNGGAGTISNLFLRGADTKYTLVLIDGVPANDPANANRAPNLANLTLDNIERVEIVRGPASLLYGSGATAGVVNIITKTGKSGGQSYAGLEVGSHAGYRLYGGSSGKSGPVRYGFALSRHVTDGFSAVDGANVVLNPTGRTYETDPYRNTAFSGKTSVALSQRAELETVVRYSDATVAYDSSIADRTGMDQESRQFNGRVALKINQEPMVSTLFYNVDMHDRNYLTNRTRTSNYNGTLYEIGWQGDLTVAEGNLLSTGVTYQHEQALVESYGASASRFEGSTGSGSIFVQDQWQLGGLALNGGFRYEDHETAGGKTTVRLAPVWMLGGTVLKCSYATGFRTPSMYELYSPYGNQSLRPETSRGWDAGIEQRTSDELKLGMTLFWMDYDDRIDFDQSLWLYAQVPGVTKTEGVESFLEWKPASTLFMTATHTYTWTQDPAGLELRRRPKNKFAMHANWQVRPETTVSASVQWIGSRYEKGAMDETGQVTNQLPSYLLANLAVSGKVSEQVTLYGRVDNLFDSWYEEAWGYATPGRVVNAGMRVTF